MKKCHLDDLQAVIDLYARCREELASRNLTQWAHGYPNNNIVERDIRNGDMWKLEDEKLLGVVVLNNSSKARYDELNWSCTENNPIEIHRLAVDPLEQGKGHAKCIMNWVEEYAQEKGYSSMRLDSWSKNKANSSLYLKLGFRQTGEQLFWPPVDSPFDCFEKIL